MGLSCLELIGGGLCRVSKHCCEPANSCIPFLLTVVFQQPQLTCKVVPASWLDCRDPCLCYVTRVILYEAASDLVGFACFPPPHEQHRIPQLLPVERRRSFVASLEALRHCGYSSYGRTTVCSSFAISCCYVDGSATLILVIRNSEWVHRRNSRNSVVFGLRFELLLIWDDFSLSNHQLFNNN